MSFCMDIFKVIGVTLLIEGRVIEEKKSPNRHRQAYDHIKEETRGEEE